MYVSRRQYGITFSTTDLFGIALGVATKASILSEAPHLIVQEHDGKDPGMYVLPESDVVVPRERRRIFAKVLGWKVEWLS